MTDSLSTLRQPLQDAFTRAFAQLPETIVRAPGRVNLIGEHTDYNDGFVLPCAIDYGTLVAIRRRDDDLMRIVAVDYGEDMDQFHANLPIEHRAESSWSNYVRGVVDALKKRGIAVNGADIGISGNVPQGAGLSSSASLEVAVLFALTYVGSYRLDLKDIALTAQQAENEFVGCNCGIMDQLISACGRAEHALLIDCRSLETRAVPLPRDIAVMIIHSGVKRGLVDSAYNERRAQCEAASRHYRVAALRDLTLVELDARAAGLEDVVLRRARHVVSENQRTLEAAAALAAGNLQRLGELMVASHASMRDDFEITVPEIDRLVEIVQATLGGQGGARMTGGGFGGCVVALMPRGHVETVKHAINAQYRTTDGGSARVWVCSATDGAGLYGGDLLCR